MCLCESVSEERNPCVSDKSVPEVRNPCVSVESVPEVRNPCVSAESVIESFSLLSFCFTGHSLEH